MLIEARLMWDGDVLALSHFPADGVVRLADFGLPRLANDDTIVYEDARLTTDACDVDGVIVRLALVARAEPLASGARDLRPLKIFAATVLLHAVLLAMAFVFQVEPDDRVPVETLRAYMAASEARELEPPPETGPREKSHAEVDELPWGPNDVFIGWPPVPLRARRWEPDGHELRRAAMIDESDGRHAKRIIAQCGALSVSHGLHPEVVRRIVRQNYGRMRFCYEAALLQSSSAASRMSVKFVVGSAGEVREAFAEDPFEDEELKSCVVRAFASLSFPEPEDGEATIVCPLTFST